MSFDSFKLDSALLAGVSDLGFTEPTDIQRDAIPWALEGRDLLACAMTGSGKTAAFALPILQRLVGQERGTTRALVLSPTRELALQIEQHFRDLAAHTPVTLASIFGGVGYEPQEKAFREGVDVLIATPGRLLDHLRRPYANLDGVEVLVLDEADRMLDMGFIPDVRRILRHVPAERQTLFFSATLAKPIQRLAGDMLVEPVTINLERRSAPAEGVRQVVYPVRHELKPALLLHLLERHDVDTALVFTRTKQRADLTGGYLKRAGVKVAVIHGDRSQQHRTRVMKQFKEGKFQVLVATDVAARGIDVEALSHVINLDVPNQPDDYIHRVGRTARAGSTGDAMTFVAARELADLHLIEKAIGQKLERVRLDDFDYSKAAAAESARTAKARPVAAGEAEPDAGQEAPEEAEAEAATGAVVGEPPSNLEAEEDAGEATVAEPEESHDATFEAGADEDGEDDGEDAERDEGDGDDDDGDDDDGDDDDGDEDDDFDDDDGDEDDEDDGDDDADDDDDEEDDDADDDDDEHGDDDDDEDEHDDDDDDDDDDDEDDDDEDDEEDEVSEPVSAEGAETKQAPARRGGGVSRAVLERYADLRERRTGRRWTPPQPASGDGDGGGEGRAKGGRKTSEEAPKRPARDRRPEPRADERQGAPRSRGGGPSPVAEELGRKPPEGGISSAVLERYADLREKRRRSGR